MKTGEYDVVSASGDASLRLIAGGDVAPVNTDLVTNYEDIFDGLKKKQWNSVDGSAYGIPHGRGANLLMYRTDMVKPAPDSWGAVFDGDSPYKGKITAYDSPIYIADAALYLMETKPDLGIKNPYALDDKQFDAAVDLLKAQNEQHRRVLVGLPQGGAGVQDRRLGARHHLADHRQPGQADKAPGRGGPARTRARPAGRTPGWSRPRPSTRTAPTVDEPHHLARRPTPQVAEWFGEAPANKLACAADRGQELLRDVPRRRRGLLRQGLVLDHPDRARAWTGART